MKGQGCFPLEEVHGASLSRSSLLGPARSPLGLCPLGQHCCLQALWADLQPHLPFLVSSRLSQIHGCPSETQNKDLKSLPAEGWNPELWLIYVVSDNAGISLSLDRGAGHAARASLTSQTASCHFTLPFASLGCPACDRHWCSSH